MYRGWIQSDNKTSTTILNNVATTCTEDGHNQTNKTSTII